MRFRRKRPSNRSRSIRRRAKAERQTELTQSAIAVEIAANRGQAEFAEAEQLAKKQVTLAEGEARSKELIGKGESSRIAQVGLAEAAVTLQKVGAYRDPRLYALNVFADQFSKSVQPLVPSRLFISNTGGKSGEGQGAGGGSVLETLLSLILSEKAGINIQEDSRQLKTAGGVHPAIYRSAATAIRRRRMRLRLPKKQSQDLAEFQAEHGSRARTRPDRVRAPFHRTDG